MQLNMEIDKSESLRGIGSSGRVPTGFATGIVTIFFHRYALHRHRLERIERLETHGGRVVEDDEGIGRVACSYFWDLFTLQGQRDMTHILLGIQSHVFEGMNVFLCSEFRQEEIVAALNAMGPNKALGEDGLPALFYRTNWPIVVKKVTTNMLQVVTTVKFQLCLN